MKKVIFVADDFGMSESVNSGIIKAFKEGVIRNTALLANGKAFEHAVKLHNKYPGLEISCHLTVSHGKSLTTNQSLTDENGFFIKNNGFNTKFLPNEEELFQEFDAQYKKILDHSIKINGINCHHNMQMYPGVKNAFLRIAHKYNQPIRNVDLKIKAKDLSNLKSINGNQTFYREKSTIQEIERIFESLNENDIIDIQTHPGFCDSDLENMSSYSKERLKEINLLCSKDLKSLIKKHKIVLTNYNKQ